jgi:hypothetical protein
MVSPCTTEYSSAASPASGCVIDTVCADRDLLRLEFEAIMSANNPAPADHPTRRPRRMLPTSATRRSPPARPGYLAPMTPQRCGPRSTTKHHRPPRQRGPPTRPASSDRDRSSRPEPVNREQGGFSFRCHRLDPSPPHRERTTAPGKRQAHPHPGAARCPSTNPHERPLRTPTVTGPTEPNKQRPSLDTRDHDPAGDHPFPNVNPRPRPTRTQASGTSSAGCRRRGPVCPDAPRCRLHQRSTPGHVIEQSPRVTHDLSDREE